MTLKKQHFAEGEIAIFDEACIYKRGEYWQFRMWLPKENKYARKSLRTLEETLQHQATTQCIGLPPTSARSHHPDGQKADHAITFNIDHSSGAAQLAEGRKKK